MLRLIPPPLHRLLYRIAHRLRVKWWRHFPPQARGVCVIAFDQGGDLLLLRQSYGTHKWVLPGGGMGRNEDPAAAAEREFAEEARCGLRDLAFLHVSEEHFKGGSSKVHIFAGRVDGMPRPDRREIVDARFFPLHALPADTDGRVLHRLALAGYHSSGS